MSALVPGWLKQRFILLIFITMSVLYCRTGYSQNVPVETVDKALQCFSDTQMYAECDEAFKLTHSGKINVPPEDTDIFCNGPCLPETRHLLDCIDNILSDFRFYNKATVKDVGNVLDDGCSYTSRRGNFDVEKYVEGERSSTRRSTNLFVFYSFVSITGWCLLIL